MIEKERCVNIVSMPIVPLFVYTEKSTLLHKKKRVCCFILFYYPISARCCCARRILEYTTTTTMISPTPGITVIKTKKIILAPRCMTQSSVQTKIGHEHGP